MVRAKIGNIMMNIKNKKNNIKKSTLCRSCKEQFVPLNKGGIVLLDN